MVHQQLGGLEDVRVQRPHHGSALVELHPGHVALWTVRRRRLGQRGVSVQEGHHGEETNLQNGGHQMAARANFGADAMTKLAQDNKNVAS